MQRFLLLSTLLLALACTVLGLGPSATPVALGQELDGVGESATDRLTTAGTANLYLPLMLDYSPWDSPLSFEIAPVYRLSDPDVRDAIRGLQASWMRINELNWREVQPTQGGPYNWAALANFENHLANAADLGLTPIIVVDDSPTWATIGNSACGAIRADRFGDFAAFLQAVVQRYSRAPYNVHYWELGNEPDVAPEQVRPTEPFGCWGDVNDPYYGGLHYGNMLRAVAPAIRQADPNAKILIGGLLLSTPGTDLDQGNPEKFFEGILRAGAPGPYDYFDVVAYHAYSSSFLTIPDVDMTIPWGERGGYTVGKVRFLRGVMQEFGIDKPIFLTETGFRCPMRINWGNGRCDNPGPNFNQQFLQPQADHAVRVSVRAMAEGVEQITWHTLNGDGWDRTGLLDEEQEPRPSYIAYQELVEQSERGQTQPVVVGDYGANSEAYRFRRNSYVVDVLWSRQFQVGENEYAVSPIEIDVPQSQFIAAFTRDGAPLNPSIVNGNARFTIGSSPIYIHRRP